MVINQDVRTLPIPIASAIIPPPNFWRCCIQAKPYFWAGCRWWSWGRAQGRKDEIGWSGILSAAGFISRCSNSWPPLAKISVLSVSSKGELHTSPHSNLLHCLQHPYQWILNPNLLFHQKTVCADHLGQRMEAKKYDEYPVLDNRNQFWWLVWRPRINRCIDKERRFSKMLNKRWKVRKITTGWGLSTHWKQSICFFSLCCSQNPSSISACFLFCEGNVWFVQFIWIREPITSSAIQRARSLSSAGIFSSHRLYQSGRLSRYSLTAASLISFLILDGKSLNRPPPVWKPFHSSLVKYWSQCIWIVFSRISVI